VKDQDLWYDDADCLVHFHAQGSSQRPPSLKIPFAAVQRSKCSYLLDNCLRARRYSNFSTPSDSGYDSCTVSSPRPQSYDLFVPAPADLTREQAYTYHVTTRNYFALLTNQALVGEKLGLALIDLWRRTKEWQPAENATSIMLSYCEHQGYLSLAENVTHATAILTFAERAQIQELWTNAFVHCVGMHDRLDLSGDYPELSNITRALITRASLEMDLHMSRATRAIGCFLEEELGADRLGLTKPARNHLDRFRGFLQSFYLEQLGYFPPDSRDPYNRQLWNNVHDDFESLYELLADKSSDQSIQNNTNASGGICCLQNTQVFNVRHGCTPLPHPSPLLPVASSDKRSTDTQKTLRSLRLGRSSSVAESKLPPRRALAEATNNVSDAISKRPIVIEYRRFERSRSEEKITIQEARKVRWLLIYGGLQILNSITRAPKGVRDLELASYPLCVLTTGSPEWHVDENEPLASDETATEVIPDLELTTPLPLTPDEEVRPESEGRISIHPDCEADSAADYFTNSRRSSVNALDMTPPPLRITRPTRTASIRTSVSSGVNVLQRSFSMARRNSSRKSTQAPRGNRMSSYEVVGSGYGTTTMKNDINEEESGSDIVGAAVEATPSANFGTTHNLWQEFDFCLPNVGEEPTLSDRHLNGLYSLHIPDELANTTEKGTDLGRLEESDEGKPGDRNSWLVDEGAFSASWPAFNEPVSATTSSSEPNSLRSSYLSEDCDTPVTIYSPSQSPRTSQRGSADFEKSHTSIRSQQSNRQRHISLASIQPDCSPASSLNVGCYRPSGLPGQSSFAPALSKFASSQTMNSFGTPSRAAGSGKYAGSAASSVYELDTQQADDREASTVRGRRRTRTSDGMASFAFAA
jgi:hypothetical protein